MKGYSFTDEGACTIYPEPIKYSDLYIVQCGQHNHASMYGPAVRKNTLIHYVYDGAGELIANGETYKVHAGQAFIIFPNIETVYRADRHWNYKWVEIGGSAVEHLHNFGISSKNPIITDKDGRMGEALNALVEGASMENTRKCHGYLWMFVDALLECGACENTITHQQKYVELVCEHIRANYWRRVTVSELSRLVGLDRSYLNKLFKAQMNIPLQEYIIMQRLRTACRFMENPDLSIGTVARSVGYEDQFTFSKAFKKHFAISPTEWRKRRISEKNQ